MNLEETNALRLEGVRENSTDGPLLGTNGPERTIEIGSAVTEYEDGDVCEVPFCKIAQYSIALPDTEAALCEAGFLGHGFQDPQSLPSVCAAITIKSFQDLSPWATCAVAAVDQ